MENTALSADACAESTHMLEPGPLGSMLERLKAGAKRLASSHDDGRFATTSKVTLRTEQTNVFTDAAAFLREASEFSDDADGCPYGRIILPPRTGKTVIAGFLVRDAQLHSLVIVPSCTLVEQTAARLGEILPPELIGVYDKDAKRPVANGVNVTTYAMLQTMVRENRGIPRAFRSAALIFADEAHHAMTASRYGFLQKIFDPRAVRIALTATPDYGAERTLNRFFPELVHELTMVEAVELGLLAPLRYWLGEVDVDASRVKVLGEDFDDGELGRVMSAAPFFEAARRFRYHPDNVKRPALITCKSRAQAIALRHYLAGRRGNHAPEPKLVLGDTPDREEILRDFAEGRCDTLVCVHVLIEGWDAPRCKLLIDLAPSLSRVRAMQKFCRVLTKYGNREARIFCLVPHGLSYMPLSPLEVLGFTAHAYRSGDLIDGLKRTRVAADQPQSLPPIIPVDRVRLVQDIHASYMVRKPLLSRSDMEATGRILRSHETYNAYRPWNHYRFKRLMFRHKLFSGTGAELLGYLGIPNTHEAYTFFIEQALGIELQTGHGRYRYRQTAASLRLREENDEYGRVQDAFDGPPECAAQHLNAENAWRALGGAVEVQPTPEDIAEARDLLGFMRKLVPRLTPIESRVMRWRFPLLEPDGENPDAHPDDEGLKCHEIGEKYQLSGNRINQLECQCARKMRTAIDQSSVFDSVALLGGGRLEEIPYMDKRPQSKQPLIRKFEANVPLLGYVEQPNLSPPPRVAWLLDPHTLRCIGYCPPLAKTQVHVGYAYDGNAFHDGKEPEKRYYSVYSGTAYINTEYADHLARRTQPKKTDK